MMKVLGSRQIVETVLISVSTYINATKISTLLKTVLKFIKARIKTLIFNSFLLTISPFNEVILYPSSA